MRYVKKLTRLIVLSGLALTLLTVSAESSYATFQAPTPTTPTPTSTQTPTQTHSVGTQQGGGEDSSPLGGATVSMEAGETVAPTQQPQQAGPNIPPPPNPCNPKSRRPDPRNIDNAVITVTFPEGESTTPMTAQQLQDECIAFTAKGCTWEMRSAEPIDPTSDAYRTDPRGAGMVNSRLKADIEWGGLQGKENKPYGRILYGISEPCLSDPNEPLRQSFLIVSSDRSSPAAQQQEIVRRAVGQLKLTPPAPHISLGSDNGTDYTLVRGHTWFATDPATFKPLSKRVQAGSAWVEVTATPVGLRFTPGMDNLPAVDCTGPGVINYGNDANNARPWWNPPPGSTCSYQYPYSSPGLPDQPITATLQTRWQIRWTGSGLTSGSLPDMFSTTTRTFAVTEAQTLVTK